MDAKKFFTEKEAAQYLSVSVNTLRKWRCRNQGGPRYFKMGIKAVRYACADLDAFVLTGVRGGSENDY